MNLGKSIFFYKRSLLLRSSLSLSDSSASSPPNSAARWQSLATIEDKVAALIDAIEAKDSYTRGHSESVARYVLLLGRTLGLSLAECRVLEVAAHLHDVGKVAIDRAILCKTGKLTHDERRLIRNHPLIGVSILGSLSIPSEVVSAVRHHHERYDGLGYPDGLSGASIPLGARILSLADAFDAMTSDRPYRTAKQIRDAVDELWIEAGRQFDPALVPVFVRALDGSGDRLLRQTAGSSGTSRTA